MRTDVSNRLIWFKGEILNVNDARINILAPTVQFGLNVFRRDSLLLGQRGKAVIRFSALKSITIGCLGRQGFLKSSAHIRRRI